MVVIDHFDGGKVVIQLPPGPPEGGNIEVHPTTLMITADDVPQQDGYIAGHHHIINVSLWIPKAKMFVPVACFTDDVAGQNYGKELLRGTPVWMPTYSFNNFFVYTKPRLSVAMNLANPSCPVLKARLNPVPEDTINLPFDQLPIDPYRDWGNLTFKLPALTLEFRGFSDTFEEHESHTMPVNSSYKMIQKTLSRPAWVRLGITSWIGNPYSPLKFVGTLYHGTRVFDFPPPPIELP